MPEGHTIHRAAADQFAMLGRQKVKVASPQGRFADGAAAIDGGRLGGIDAYGKHLLYRFPKTTLHVHLGLYGDFTAHANFDAPPPRPTTRVRLVGKSHTVDLVGPNQCELLDDAGVTTLLARLGPDPLRADADAELAWLRIHASRAPVGQLLMDQRVIAGIGNIYRAEVLWLTRVPPALPGRELSRERFDAIWRETIRLMTLGRDMDRIVTTDLAAITKPIEKLTRVERFNIYKNEHCPRCAAAIATTRLAGRTVYACPACQSGEPEQKPKRRRKSLPPSGR
jgi:endonuclease-8